ncbi:MAG: DUF4846 domain-containing protein [Cytophagaceae bacterium]|nr:DUF4846 domain-containing protein [Cytophagaceae bacterium]MDW8455606.1 DUF4846 domain-containing protein [Cytophagaceae bacterium]
MKHCFLFCLATLCACSQEIKRNEPDTALIVPASTAQACSNKIEKDTSTHNRYMWIDKNNPEHYVINNIQVPDGYKRVEVEKNSFGDWLRHLPVKQGSREVLLYNGTPKTNQTAQHLVLNVDVGNEDLQQCADAIMRLKAEYHYSRGEYDNIHFNFTSGDKASYKKWIEGYRPVVKNNKVTWVLNSPKEDSYKQFKAYLRQVFMYAGTSSLSKELIPVRIEQIQPGDVFIKGGFPGHAVIVMDVAVNEKNNEKIFLLAQSYMPAQEIHILKNPQNETLSPWYSTKFGEILVTPEWNFEASQLKRFAK